MKIGTWTVAAVIGVSCVGAMQSRAQTAPADPNATGPMVGDQARPPDWVQPGARIVFYTASATLAAANAGEPVLVPDPNGPYVGPDGRRYRSETGDATASGQGYIVADILLLDGPYVFVRNTIYTIPGMSGPAMLSGSHTDRADAATAGGAYMHPATLANLQPQTTPEMTIAHGAHQIGQASYDAVAIQNRGSISFFDKRSGLRIKHSMKTQKSIGSRTIGGMDDDLRTTGPAVRTSLSQMELRRFRMRQMPWITPTPAPPGLPQTRSILYRGGQVVTVPGGIPPVNLPMTLKTEFLELGNGWARIRNTSQVSGAPGMPPQVNTAEEFVVFGSLGSFWMHPAVLGQMRDGQVLDQEPIVGSSTTANLVQGAEGRTLVAITDDAPGYTSRATYDQQSGLLVRAEQTNKALNITMFIEYAGTETR